MVTSKETIGGNSLSREVHKGVWLNGKAVGNMSGKESELYIEDCDEKVSTTTVPCPVACVRVNAHAVCKRVPECCETVCRSIRVYVDRYVCAPMGMSNEA